MEPHAGCITFHGGARRPVYQQETISRHPSISRLSDPLTVNVNTHDGIDEGSGKGLCKCTFREPLDGPWWWIDSSSKCPDIPSASSILGRGHLGDQGILLWVLFKTVQFPTYLLQAQISPNRIKSSSLSPTREVRKRHARRAQSPEVGCWSAMHS